MSNTTTHHGLKNHQIAGLVSAISARLHDRMHLPQMTREIVRGAALDYLHSNGLAVDTADISVFPSGERETAYKKHIAELSAENAALRKQLAEAQRDLSEARGAAMSAAIEMTPLKSAEVPMDGWKLERKDDAIIVSKDGVGGYAARPNDDNIASEILYSLAESMLAAAPMQEPAAPTREHLIDWTGVDGAIAWHLIDRHADGWSEVGQMMDEWRRANPADKRGTEGKS